jgi:hypothetical protein
MIISTIKEKEKMEQSTYETIIRVLAEKLELEEYKVKMLEEENRKLKEQIK